MEALVMKNSFMENELGRFEESLREDERAGNTVSKYVRDVRMMLEFLAKRARAERREADAIGGRSGQKNIYIMEIMYIQVERKRIFLLNP